MVAHGESEIIAGQQELAPAIASSVLKPSSSCAFPPTARRAARRALSELQR